MRAVQALMLVSFRLLGCVDELWVFIEPLDDLYTCANGSEWANCGK